MTGYNAEIVQGDDATFVVSIKDKTETAIDLTGSTAITFQAKLTIDGNAYISKTLGSGIVITDAANGEITITLSSTDTSSDNLPAGEYLFEIQVTNASNKINTVRDFNNCFGVLTVLSDLDI